MNNSIEAILQINDISLHFSTHGSGEPLLLLHGGGTGEACFDNMRPGLALHFQVITPDSRAQGKSTDSGEPLSYQLMCSDMICLLDTLGIEKAHIGGWSDGACIAIHMALYHPDRIKSLVLTPGDLSIEWLEDQFWEDAKANNWEFPDSLVAWWKSRKSPTSEELSKIETPTLIIAGENEQYVKHEHFMMWSKTIPNSELIWIEGVDHFLVYTAPEKVNHEIISFCSTIITQKR